MPRQPDPPESSGARDVRRKLAPSFSFLLELERRGQLTKVKEQETQSLRALEGRIRAIQKQHRLEKDPFKARVHEVELARLRDKLFSPLTAGIHLPSDPSSLASRKARLKETFVSALVRLKEPDRRRLEAIHKDIRVRCGAGRIFSVYVPLSVVPLLEKSSWIEYIEIARPLFPNLGDAIPIAGIDAVHGTGHRGANTIVGVIDDGLDVYHLDFRDGAGKTRVLFLRDQTLGAGTGGIEYTDSDIDLEIDNSEHHGAAKYATVKHFPDETATHGTAVTGCAAGNGRAWDAFLASLGATAPAGLPNRPEGAAPDADIIFVRPGTIDGTTLLADSTEVLEAFTYIFDKADDPGVNEACVVNLSDSDNQGPHDGTSLGEQFLDALLLAPRAANQGGRAITLSAGNSTGTYSHARGTVKAGQVLALVLNYNSIGADFPRNNDAIEIWSPAGTPLPVTVTVPGTAGSTVLPTVNPNTQLTATVGGIEVIVTSVVGDARNGDNLIQILIFVGAGKNIPTGHWMIELDNGSGADVAFDAWIDRNNRGFATWAASSNRNIPGPRELGEQAVTLGVPSTAQGPITVGSHDKPSPPLKPDVAISPSSGLGSTRKDAYTKPDLAAVGESVLAPFPTNLLTRNSYPYEWVSGTSFSAPIVAGACAVLFERDGTNQTCSQLKAKLTGPLTQAAMPPGPAVPDVGFGFGPLRMP